jgi:proteic killer suppression protein|tara:strand:+ start:430 stop:708 length:279 start_codon:yes stop_codon:yes gene_type:complete
MAITGIKNKGLKELFTKGTTAKIELQYHANCLLILSFLDAIGDISDCQGVKDFHRLKGRRKNHYSMHVSGNWVISFEWEKPDVLIINFEDYH